MILKTINSSLVVLKILCAFLFFKIYLQVQALVGFEKTVKHLDEHLVDISTKVSMRYPCFRSQLVFMCVCVWNTVDRLIFFDPSGNHKAKAGEEVQRGGYAIAYEQQKRRSLRHF